MKQRTLICMAMLVAGTSACGSSTRSDDFDAFAKRVSALEDRDALKQAIVDAVSEVEGSEIDAAAQAKLDVIEARVDELDGLLYRVDTAQGATLKFFEPAPGQVYVAFIGPSELSETFSMEGLSPAEIYRLAVPEGRVPAVLVEATERQAELLRRGAPSAEWIGQPGPAEVAELSTGTEQAEPTGSVTQHHLVAHHSFISNYDWQSHCYAYGTQCEPGLKGQRAFEAKYQFGWEWRYVLNVRDPNGTALGTIMTGTFAMRGIGPTEECQLYGDWCADTQPDPDLYYPAPKTIGPLVSGVGDMVVVNTRTSWDCLHHSFWYPNGCSQYGYKLGHHRGDFIAGPNAQWHLASRDRNDYPTWSTWGNFVIP